MSTGNRIQALIDGEEIFQSLYNDIQAVDSEGFIYLCFWMFDPQMTLDVRTGQILGNIIARKANQGVKIRILLWDYYAVLAEQILRGRSSILPYTALPGISGFIRLIIGPAISDTLWQRFVQHRFVTTDNVLQLVNGLRARRPRPNVELCLAPFPDPTIPPGLARILGLDIGSHHQKTAIINMPGRSGRRLRAYVLGTNLHDDYHDNQDHRINYPQTSDSLRTRPWHDTGAVAEGPVANEIEEEFIRRWELQRQNYPGLTSIRPSGITQSFSQNMQSELLITSPIPPPNSIRQALLDHIGRARLSVYIEDQYFFNLELTNALINQAVRVEDAGGRLHICLLTNGPNEFKANGIDLPMELFRFINFTSLQLATCEGVHVQGQTPFRLIRRRTGERWSLVPDTGEQRWNLPNLQIIRQHGDPLRLVDVRQIVGGVRPAYALSTDGRGQAETNRTVYIHSKLTIIDDRIVFIGSANYSVRSMEYDSEATLKINNRDLAGDIRLRLFEEMTGNERITQMSHEQQFTYWNECAERNAMFRTLDESQMTGASVNIIRYPSGVPNFLGLRRRIGSYLSQTNPILLRLLGRFMGNEALTARLTDLQFLRLLEALYPLH